MSAMEWAMPILLNEGISYVKSNWSPHSKVEQRLRRLRQLVVMVQAVVDAAEGISGAAVRESFSAWMSELRSEAMRGQEVLDEAARSAVARSSIGRFVADLKALFVSSSDVERITEAIEQLENLARPDGDLDTLFKVLASRAATMDMDIDSALYRQEGSGCSYGSTGTVAAFLSSRKRTLDGSGVDDGPASRGEINAVQRKRRCLAWMRSHPRLSSGFDAPREGSGSSCGSVGTVAPLLPSRKRALNDSGVDNGHTSRGEADAMQPKRRCLAWMRSHPGLPSGFDAPHEGSTRSCGSTGTVAPLLPSLKRVLDGSGVDDGATSRGQELKRRHLAWTQSHSGLLSGVGAPSETSASVLPRSLRARRAALAFRRVQRQIRKPTRHHQQPSLVRQLSQVTL